MSTNVDCQLSTPLVHFFSHKTTNKPVQWFWIASDNNRNGSKSHQDCLSNLLGMSRDELIVLTVDVSLWPRMVGSFREV
jgi:hypothetical protein